MTVNEADYATLSELDELLRKHPEIESIDAFFPDMSGIIRGKRLTLDHARRLFDGGHQIPGSMLLLAVTGSCLDPLGHGVSDGDPDVLIRPLAGTLCAVPWSQPPRAQVMVGFLDEAGNGNAFEPREILSRVAARFDSLNLLPVVACELEFSLIARERGADGVPQRPVSPVSGSRHDGTQLMSLAYVDDFGDFIDAVTRACNALSIPLTAINAEYGGDQFEINLHHVSGAVRAADDAVRLKQVVQSVAVAHGLRATFMAKPYAETAGNGMHWHVSLVAPDSSNAFDETRTDGEACMQNAIGGVLKTLPESMAFSAANLNAYKRFRPGLFVPMSRSWGYNNRSVALRVPAGPATDRRLEFRVAGADANPYLVLAALLAGVHYGLENRLSAPPPCTGNAGESVDAGMPLRLYDALRTLDEAQVLPGYLGRDYCAIYAAAKRLEADAFLADLSRREFEWYLRPEA